MLLNGSSLNSVVLNGNGAAPSISGTCATGQADESVIAVASLSFIGSVGTGQAQTISGAASEQFIGNVDSGQADESASGNATLQFAGDVSTSQADQSVNINASLAFSGDVVTGQADQSAIADALLVISGDAVTAQANQSVIGGDANANVGDVVTGQSDQSVDATAASHSRSTGGGSSHGIYPMHKPSRNYGYAEASQDAGSISAAGTVTPQSITGSIETSQKSAEIYFIADYNDRRLKNMRKAAILASLLAA